MRRIARALLAAMALSGAAVACEPNPNPDLRPWKERVAGTSPMFIGTVVEIRGEGGQVWRDVPVCQGSDKSECEAYFFGLGEVVFEVELPINGISEATFTVEQGHGTDCRLEFRLGQRWLFAGNFLESPTMYLNDSYDWKKAHETREPVK